MPKISEFISIKNWFRSCVYKRTCKIGTYFVSSLGNIITNHLMKTAGTIAMCYDESYNFDDKPQLIHRCNWITNALLMLLQSPSSKLQSCPGSTPPRLSSAVCPPPSFLVYKMMNWAAPHSGLLLLWLYLEYVAL